MKLNEMNQALWESNSEAWTTLSRLGYDKWRNLVNAPAFLKMLPDVNGQLGLDVGCGEGYNTRLVYEKGARKIYAFDVSKNFINHADTEAKRCNYNIQHLNASGIYIPFDNNSFDFVMATMSLMDMPDVRVVIKEIHRVLKPNGVFQFSISHPCFGVSMSDYLFDAEGKRCGVVIKDYFNKQQGKIDEWIFSGAPTELSGQYPKFRIPRFDHTLSEWLNMLINAGFTLSQFDEPKPEGDVLQHFSKFSKSGLIPFSLIVQALKR